MAEAERPADVPDNAPEHCPGTSSEMAGKAASCAGCPNQAACSSAPKGPDPGLVAIQQRLKGVKHRILVLSGKGGVGKSTFSTQLAFALAARGFEVGLLDIDICGPSVPKMLGLQGSEIHQSNAGWSPVYVTDNLGVMSIGFMLPNPDDAIIWRGPRKNGLIKQFLRDVDWGELDFLVVDSPPGTSDEHITITQYLEADGAIIVTTPQDVSVIDVRKEASFCKKVNLPVVGVVENMSGLVQRAPAFKFVKGTGGSVEDVTDQVMKALEAVVGDLSSLVLQTDVFQVGASGTAKLCQDFGLDLLGRVPLDPQLGKAAEQGVSAFEGSEAMLAAPALEEIVTRMLSKMGSPQPAQPQQVANGAGVI